MDCGFKRGSTNNSQDETTATPKCVEQTRFELKLDFDAGPIGQPHNHGACNAQTHDAQIQMIKRTHKLFNISKIPNGPIQHLINSRKANNQILKTYFSTTEQKVLKKYILRQEKIHLKILNEYYNPEKWSISGITKIIII